ncbi:hypothetical protein KIN20_003754, partial [Parelaphostrongylus tenuis]
MVSTSPTAAAQVPGIATSKGAAQAFVHRLVMQTALKKEGRRNVSRISTTVLSTSRQLIKISFLHFHISFHLYLRQLVECATWNRMRKHSVL